MDYTGYDRLFLYTLKAFLSNSTDMIFIKDRDLVYRGASAPFLHMAGLQDISELEGKTDFDIFERALAEKYRIYDRHVLEICDLTDYIGPLPDVDERQRCCLTSKYRILDDDGEVIGLFGISHDVTAQLELAEKNRELEACAATDQLTGVLNRRAVIERIMDVLCPECGEAAHALLFIDLDGFKGVNDSLGHPIGDRVLRETAERLRETFRHDDIVGRVGGDEFLVLLRGAHCRRDVEARAGRVLGILPVVEDMGEKKQITCSIGVAMCAPGKSFEQLYSEADKAMYAAKAKGRNRIEFHI